MNKLGNLLILSLSLHLILFITFTQSFFKAPLLIVKKNNLIKPIQAKLYFPIVEKKSTVAPTKESSVSEENLLTQKKINNAKSIEKRTAKKAIKPVTKTDKLSKKMPTKIILTSNLSSKNITQSSLDKLKQRLNVQAQESAKNDSYNQHLINKNVIAPSKTKFNQLPLAKAKIKEVDCNSSKLNIAVTAISGLLGGTVRCNSMPDLKGFLENRAKESGR